MRRGAAITSGALLFGLLAVTGFVVARHVVRTSPTIARKVNGPLPVAVAAVSQQELERIIGGDGTVKPLEVLQLTSRVPVRIQRVSADYGDVVSVGQVLAEYDREVLGATIAAARGEVERSRAELERAVERLARVKRTYERGLSGAIVGTAAAVVEKATGDRDRAAQKVQRTQAIYEQGLSVAMVKTAEAALEKAAGDRDRAAQKVQRIKAIYDLGLLAKSDLEKAEAELDRARADYSRAVEDLLRAKKDLPSELEKAQADLDRAKEEYSRAGEDLLRTQKDLPSELEKAQADLDRAKANYSGAMEKLARASEELKYGSVVATVPGIVMERLTNPGETPAVNQRLFTIGRIDEVLIETKVAEEHAGNIALQQQATVTFNAFPNESLTGEVVKIKPVIDQQTRTFLVDVKVKNVGLKLKPGLTAFVRVTQKRQTLAVPTVSLIKPTGVRDSAVFVVEDGLVARARKVKIGVSSNGMTEVLEGLTSGEKVVAVGQLYLRDGGRVRIGDEFDAIKTRVAQRLATPQKLATP